MIHYDDIITSDIAEVRPNFKVCPVCGGKMKYVWVVENGGGGVNFMKANFGPCHCQATQNNFEPYRCEWCGFLRLVPNEEAW